MTNTTLIKKLVAALKALVEDIDDLGAPMDITMEQARAILARAEAPTP